MPFHLKFLKPVAEVGLLIGDIIPIPLARPIFEAAKMIAQIAETVKLNRAQLTALASIIVAYGNILNSGDMSETKLQEHADSLSTLFADISDFVTEFGQLTPYQQLWSYQKVSDNIKGYHEQIQRACNTLQFAAQIASYKQLRDLETSRAEDQVELNHILDEVLNRQEALEVLLSDNQVTTLDAMRQLQLLMIGQEASTRAYLVQILSLLQRCTTEKKPLQANKIDVGDITKKVWIADGPFYTLSVAFWSNATVAVKEFYSSIPASLFDNEIQIWTNLHHPNIIELFGASFDSNKRLAVMPFCKDRDVLSYISKHPQANRIKLICGVVAGLEYLHSKSVVHGELRAHNVLVDDSGNIKITDFGMSHFKTHTGSTGDRALPDTDPRWLSPERITRNKIDTVADIYSLGVTMWEIITLKRPWQGYSIVEVKQRITDGETLQIPEESTLPTEFWTLVKLCWIMHPSPSKRPSARSVGKKLKAMSAIHDFDNTWRHLNVHSQASAEELLKLAASLNEIRNSYTRLGLGTSQMLASLEQEAESMKQKAGVSRKTDHIGDI